MGTKRITDLTATAAVAADQYAPVDDGIQSYKASFAQIKTFILSAAAITKAMLAQGANAKLFTRTVTASTGTFAVATDDLLIGDCTSNAIEFALPAVSGLAGQKASFMKSDSSSNALTLNASGSETINGALTMILRKQYDYVVLLCTGTEWIVETQRKSLAVAYQKWDTTNGNGSTDTKITRWTNNTISTDLDGLLTVTNNSTNGLYVTVNKKCRISISAGWGPNNTGGNQGISKNSNQLTTSISGITKSHVMVMDSTIAANTPLSVAMTDLAEPGDVYRMHANGLASGSDAADDHLYIVAEERF